MYIHSFFKGLILIGSLFVLVSCGSQGGQMVDDVKLDTEQINGDVVLSLSATLNIGNLRLPQASFPVKLPNRLGDSGILSLYTDSQGKSKMDLQINVSDSIDLDMDSARLPNGAVLPLIGNNAVIEIPTKNVTIYISLVDGAQAIGVAVPIKSFDSLGRKVGTTALMPIFNKNGNIGAAGIFTSKTAGENGFALVADISDKVGDIGIPADFIQMEVDDSENFSDYSPSRSKEKRINRELYKMHRRSKKLKL